MDSFTLENAIAILFTIKLKILLRNINRIAYALQQQKKMLRLIKMKGVILPKGDKMRVAIYGAGSLGTVLGAYITKAGEQIDLINRNKAHIEALNSSGAQIIGKANFNVKVNALLPDEMSGKYDIIFLMTKQLDNKAVVTQLTNFLYEDGVVCTMQNGLPEHSVSEVIGEDKTYGCAIGWGAQMTKPGVSELTSEPDSLVFALGAMNKASEEDAHFKEIIRLLSIMGIVEIQDNFIGVRWSKLLVNSAFSGMSAVLGCNFGEVSDNKTARRYAQRIIKEIIDSTKSGGIKIEPIQGKDVVKLLDYNNTFKQKLSFMIIPIAIKKHRLIRASMLQDIEKGKPCEVEAINGVVSDYGRKVGVPTPVNDKVIDLIHEIEAGKRRPSFDNLSEFVTALKT